MIAARISQPGGGESLLRRARPEPCEATGERTHGRLWRRVRRRCRSIFTLAGIDRLEAREKEARAEA